MQYTTLRFASLGLPFVLVVGSAAACGQVTGLSNDYEFDLVEGGGADGGAGGDAKLDGPSSDASTTDAPGLDAADAANKCTTAETATALQRLNTLGGTTSCKTCLAPACCKDIDVCFHNPDCSSVLECKLDCTTRTSAERQQCFKSCNSGGGGVPDLYTSGMGACAASACKSECAFQ
ncbi:MAG: hypothetical protein JWP87_2471 [Labilithrix sp.]|jgi:hypothetical protein|nr:hypothetical protein [Labilithrix sp.]